MVAGKTSLSVMKANGDKTFSTDDDQNGPQKQTEPSSQVRDEELKQIISKTELVLTELLSRLKKASIKCLGRIGNNDAALLEKQMQVSLYMRNVNSLTGVLKDD